MQEIITSIAASWQTYSLNTVNLVLYWSALAYLFFRKKTGGGLYIGILACVIPLMITALLTLNLRFGGGGTFEKGFYLLPCLALFCYVGTDLGTEVLKNKKTWIIAVLYAIIIQAGASMQYDIAAPRGLTSLHKVEYTTIWLADYISEHCSKEIYMFAPQEIACGIQEYEPDIRVAYGEGFDYDADDLAALLVRMDEYGCNCLVVPWEDQVNDDGSEKETAEYIMSTGYRKLVLYDGYTVYVRQTI